MGVRFREAEWEASLDGPEQQVHVFGLFVGIDEYKYVPKLSGCANDARLLADVLRPISEFSKVMIDEQATRSGVLQNLEDLLDAATKYRDSVKHLHVPPDILIVVFVSGHGKKAYDTLFVLPTDVKPERFLSGGFPFSFVARALASIDVPSLIIVDICDAGTLGLEALATCGAQQGIMMSAGPGEYSLEGKCDRDEPNHGFFSYALAKAFGRAMAGDSEQGTSLQDAFDAAYLDTKARSELNQHPVFFGTLSGRLDLRRNIPS